MMNIEIDSQTAVRDFCVGELPLGGRVEPWMAAAIDSRSLHGLVEEYGSPLNLINADPFKRNIQNLRTVAANHELDFEVFFARKSNKCLSFVHAANEVAAGVDVASLAELQQVLGTGTRPEKVICTAAIKTKQLLELCIAEGVTIAVDNLDELSQIRSLLKHRNAEVTAVSDKAAVVALRIGGFHFEGSKLHTRFGFDVDEIVDVVSAQWPSSEGDVAPVIGGLHFHLDGYCGKQRVAAIEQSLEIANHLKKAGHKIEFLDIGGGMPISYLESSTQWESFWSELEQALLETRPPLTYRNHGLGLMAVDGAIVGKRNSYPFYQTLTGSDWFDAILWSQSGSETIASKIRNANLQLRCEPGRSLLDGSGMTVARVEFRKQHPNGDWLIGLAMNRTQCRTSSDDFLVDPLLIPTATANPSDDVNESCRETMSGFLVGAYCTESELICLRRLVFPQGVKVGDLLCFANTAGYLMHFLESRSHQFPLAKNIVSNSGQWRLDQIDK